MTRKPTIYEMLSQRLGRVQSHQETVDEVRRILQEGLVEIASAGKLSWQRKRRA